MNVLITGGAGFIGTNLARRLSQEQCVVTVLDNFNKQIHGDNVDIAKDLREKVRLIKGSVTDKEIFHQALVNQDVVVHLAAETGTGQSMYEVERYEDVNVKGTAILLNYLVNHEHAIKKVIVASSRAIYGEGKYKCLEHNIVYPLSRNADNMKNGIFEPLCPICGSVCEMVATDEASQVIPSSFYGLTKLMQEKMVLMFAQALGISGFALRYQNVYGPGQSLNNPYTGILAIFSNQARVNKPINIFEDGNESRDFVYIEDVVEATWRCIKPETMGVAALNVGSGYRTTVKEVVQEVIGFFNSSSVVSITGAFREGDIRHNVADLKRVKEMIGYEPKWDFSAGIKEFLSWTLTQKLDNKADKYSESLKEMQDKGLMYGG